MIRATVFGPVRGHPLLPAGTACWFAALFGLSALAIRPDQMEAFVVLTGAERLVPVIAPSLGMAARVLTALGFAFAGGLIGAALGRAWAIRPHVKAKRPRRLLLAPPSLPVTAAAAEALTDQAMAGIEGALTDAPLTAEHEPVAEFAAPWPPLGKAAEKLLSADITTLSPIQLVERLGIAMQCRGPRPLEAVPFSASPAVLTALRPGNPVQTGIGDSIGSGIDRGRVSGAA